MALPSITSISIDGQSFNAFATHFSVSTGRDHNGVPMMGSLTNAIEVTVDMHDDLNMPYTLLQKLYDLSTIVTRDKFKDIKITFWKDDSKQNALCTLAFQGWLSNLSINSGGEGNHILGLRLQPVLDTKQFGKVKMSN